ncbi:hypothetical protein HW555_013518, partial [Spodoptera exigua]
MVGTTTKATARQVTSNGAINPATQAAILAAAAVAQDDGLGPAGETAAERRARRRRTRWMGSEHDKTFIPGLPTVLPSTLTREQEEQYLLASVGASRQLGQYTNAAVWPRLANPFPCSAAADRGGVAQAALGRPRHPRQHRGEVPSPEPIYSTDGKRLNTREYRTRRKLEEERHRLVTRMHQINPDFKPPPDYKYVRSSARRASLVGPCLISLYCVPRPPIIRVHDKVMIPQEEHPDINFVGLLIGPRGNTLKGQLHRCVRRVRSLCVLMLFVRFVAAMEKETGAKIIIRGKGSVKEGKVGRKDGQPLPGEDEPLHAYITATNADCVKKAVEKIKEVIRQGVEVPEGQNDLRRMQLRELAQLNGTLRENDAVRCANCSATDHKTWLCPDKPNVTNSIVCSSCGGAGHIARDCRAKRPGQGTLHSASNKAKIDEEYLSLMAELGEAAPGGGGGGAGGAARRFGAGLFAPHAPPRPIMAPPL